MARPQKRGLDSFPLDVDIFSNKKVVAISGEFGTKGEMTIVRLLCAIYQNGYFILWDERLNDKLFRSMRGVSKNLICDIVLRLVKLDFFNQDIFNEHSVLTSQSIQRRYFAIARRNRTSLPDDMPYLLISIDKKSKTSPKKATEKPSVTLAPLAGVVSPTTRRTIDEKIADIKRDDLWLDQAQLSIHMPKEEILKCLDDFKVHCHVYAYDDNSTTVNDVKRHFIRWMHRRPKTIEGSDSKKFIPPTVAEVQALINEMGYHFDAETFVAFYESKGWMVGESKMENWQSAAVTWEKRSIQNQTQRNNDRIRYNRQSNADEERQRRGVEYAQHIAQLLANPTGTDMHSTISDI